MKREKKTSTKKSNAFFLQGKKIIEFIQEIVVASFVNTRVRWEGKVTSMKFQFAGESGE